MALQELREKPVVSSQRLGQCASFSRLITLLALVQEFSSVLLSVINRMFFYLTGEKEEVGENRKR